MMLLRLDDNNDTYGYVFCMSGVLLSSFGSGSKGPFSLYLREGFLSSLLQRGEETYKTATTTITTYYFTGLPLAFLCFCFQHGIRTGKNRVGQDRRIRQYSWVGRKKTTTADCRRTRGGQGNNISSSRKLALAV